MNVYKVYLQYGFTIEGLKLLIYKWVTVSVKSMQHNMISGVQYMYKVCKHHMESIDP